MFNTNLASIKYAPEENDILFGTHANKHCWAMFDNIGWSTSTGDRREITVTPPLGGAIHATQANMIRAAQSFAGIAFPAF
jgi:hypothetical protein